MDTVLDSLVVKIRADTRALDQGVATATARLERLQAVSTEVEATASSLVGRGADFGAALATGAELGSRRVADSLERMARNGRLSFKSLENAALTSIAQIVTSLAGAGFDALLSGGRSGGLAGGLAGGGFLHRILPGRAGGGTVSSGQPYMVGERGPELFVPGSAGRIVTAASAQAGPMAERPVNITINLQSTGTPEAIRQSGAQMARAVRRALARG